LGIRGKKFLGPLKGGTKGGFHLEGIIKKASKRLGPHPNTFVPFP